MKTNDKFFRGIEVACENERILTHLVPEGADEMALPRGKAPYFKKYGFKVPNSLSPLYALYNGIESEKYISATLYLYYILPYLDDLNMKQAYSDKNMYGVYFKGVNMPVPVLHNMNGLFYSPERSLITREEALERLAGRGKFIIKPSIHSGCGRDVQLVDGAQLSREALQQLLDTYESDYIVQEVAQQHELMKQFNASSLNTCRLCTYRRLGTQEHVLLSALLRFGSTGDIRDNACAGGGFCRINPDGTVDDAIHRYMHPRCGSLKADKGLSNPVVPHFDKVVALVLQLHKTLPYFGIMSWDIAVDEHGEPLFVELNAHGDPEISQIAYGPLFGDYTDELMEQVQHYRSECKPIMKRSYDSRPAHYRYLYDWGHDLNIL